MSIKKELLARIREYQSRMAKRVVRYDMVSDVRYVCGVDSAYSGGAYTVAVIVDIDSKKEVYREQYISKVSVPYMSTYLFLREAAPILQALRRLCDHRYDIILVDGNGILHPRLFGIACYIGLLVDKPTIGVSKSLLCGDIVDESIVMHGEVVGKALRLSTKNKSKNKSIYVSIGHKISLDTASSIVKRLLIKDGKELGAPLPLMLADRYANELRRSLALQQTSRIHR